jgi:Domain of unknown function (DUF4504)
MARAGFQAVLDHLQDGAERPRETSQPLATSMRAHEATWPNATTPSSANGTPAQRTTWPTASVPSSANGVTAHGTTWPNATTPSSANGMPAHGPTCSGKAVPVLALGSVAGAPLLPTLNGWLLGYPVVYLLDADGVGAASDALSSSPLVQCSLRVSSPVLQVGFPV